MKEDKKIVCPSVCPEKLAELNDLKEKLDSLPHDALMFVRGAVEALRAVS